MIASLNLFSEKYFSPRFQCFAFLASLLQPDKPERAKKERMVKVKTNLLVLERFIHARSSTNDIRQIVQKFLGSYYILMTKKMPTHFFVMVPNMFEACQFALGFDLSALSFEFSVLCFELWTLSFVSWLSPIAPSLLPSALSFDL